MKRVGLSLAVLVLTLFGLFLPVIKFAQPSGSVGADPVRISDYHGEFTVDRDGTLQATETVTAQFPYGRHGIFRYWDITDPGNSGVRFFPENISIQMDGRDVPFELSWEQDRRFRVAKIGDPDAFVPQGEHVYVLRYSVDGTLAKGNSPARRGDTSSWGSDEAARFIWRVVADGWQMTIDRSTSVVHLPEEPTSFTCSTNGDIACQVEETSPTTRTVTTGSLPPMTGVAVRADLPFPAPSRSTLPWPVLLDPVFGRSLIGLILVCIVSVLTCLGGLWWALRSRERAPLLPVMYSPPTDPQDEKSELSPAQTFYVAYEKMPRKALVATLFHLAETGAVTLERHGDDWSVISQLTPEKTAALDPSGRAVIVALGLSKAGSRFEANGSVSAGQRLKSAQSSLESAVTVWGAASGTVKHSPMENGGRALVAGAVILAAVLLIFGWVPATIWVLPLAAFAIGGAGLWSSGVGTRRTRLGREVWSRAGGFERLLSTRSNQERLDFSARKELFTSFIPYAIAFDCADAWADKYRYATGQEPPDPVWFGPGFYHTSYFGGFGGAGSAFDSFESSLSSSLSAYSASQSSSSSGGGGFGGGFSGGGGGGGGGGSW